MRWRHRVRTTSAARAPGLSERTRAGPGGVAETQHMVHMRPQLCHWQLDVLKATFLRLSFSQKKKKKKEEKDADSVGPVLFLYAS